MFYTNSNTQYFHTHNDWTDMHWFVEMESETVKYLFCLNNYETQ